MEIVVPWPGAVFTSTKPSDRSTIHHTVASPSPVPSPRSFVVNDPPPLRHRVTGVHHEIHDDLSDRHRIRANARVSGIQVQFERASILQQWIQQRDAVSYRVRETDVLALKPTPPGEHQEPCRDVRRPFSGLDDRLEVPNRVFDAIRAEPQGRMPRHREQDVVEVVRHAAGQLADRLHLLRLEKLFLESSAMFELALEFIVPAGQLLGRLLEPPVQTPHVRHRVVPGLEKHEQIGDARIDGEIAETESLIREL